MRHGLAGASTTTTAQAFSCRKDHEQVVEVWWWQVGKLQEGSSRRCVRAGRRLSSPAVPCRAVPGQGTMWPELCEQG